MFNQLNIIAPICGSQTSYSVVACNLICALEELGIECSVWPLGPVSFESHQQETLIKCLNRSKIGYSQKSPCIRLYHQFSQDLFCGSPRIAFVIFELDKFNKLEKYQLSQVDMIFVTSEWGKQIVQSEIPNVLVEVVRLGVDSSIFFPKVNTDKTTRYTLISKVEIRKSSLEIVDAFNSTFSEKDDVELVLLWHNIFEKDMLKWDNYAKQSKLGDKIRIVGRVESQKEVAKLIQESDCVVSLAHSEGWNLSATEAMACGKFPIITNCTAQTEFCNSDNSLLIPMDGVEPAYDGVFFLGTGFDGNPGSWYSIGGRQVDHFKEYLLEIHTLKQSGKLKENEAGIVTAKQLSWENSAKRVIQILGLG